MTSYPINNYTHMLDREPVGCDGLVDIFTTTQIDQWGLPEEWGWRGVAYHVIERPCYALTYAEETRVARVVEAARRPVHRYSRVERFRTLLQHLMGIHGRVPPHIVEACAEAEGWEETRAILKARGWALYYSRIPIIMAAHEEEARYIDQMNAYTRTYERILAQFADMDAAWPAVRGELGRAYFPNLRFCAMRLMVMNGVMHLANVPPLRTRKKVESVGAIFEHILTFIQAQRILEWLAEDQ